MAEEDCSLDQLLAAGSGAAFYEYDFGDSWLHRLEVVTRRPRNEDDPPARLLAGGRRGPLEDSGGFRGTRRFWICSLTLLIRITSKYRNG
jgi:hypothetical protein